jgi:hypothetical protein
MKLKLLFPLTFALLSTASPSKGQSWLDAVLKSCEKTNIVYGLDEKGGVVKVGEAIAPYCQWFLEGVLTILVRAKSVCLKGAAPSPEFLLSAVLTYRMATKSQDNDAATVIEAAFKRAFTCSR